MVIARPRMQAYGGRQLATMDTRNGPTMVGKLTNARRVMDVHIFMERWRRFAQPTQLKHKDQPDIFALWEGGKALADLDQAGLKDSIFAPEDAGRKPAWKLALFFELNRLGNLYRDAAADSAKIRKCYSAITKILISAQTKITTNQSILKCEQVRKVQSFKNKLLATLKHMEHQAHAQVDHFWNLHSWGDVLNRSEPSAIPGRSHDLDGEFQRRVFRVLYVRLDVPPLDRATLVRLVLLTYFAAGLAIVKDGHACLTRTASELTFQHVVRNLRKVEIPEAEGEPDLYPAERMGKRRRKGHPRQTTQKDLRPENLRQSGPA